MVVRSWCLPSLTLRARLWLVEVNEWADGRGTVGERDDALEPGLPVDAADEAPGGLVVRELEMLAVGDGDLALVGDDVAAPVDQAQIAGGAERREFFRDDERHAEGGHRELFAGVRNPDHVAGGVRNLD